MSEHDVLLNGVMDLFPGADRQALTCLAELMDKAHAEGAKPDAHRQGRGEWKPTHRHVKRSSTYRIIGEAEAQVSTGTLLTLSGEVICARTVRDGDRLTVYQGKDGKLWVRLSDEFSDGRFAPLPDEEA